MKPNHISHETCISHKSCHSKFIKLKNVLMKTRSSVNIKVSVQELYEQKIHKINQ